MSLGKVASAFLLPVGLGGLGVGKNPFGGDKGEGGAAAPLPMPEAPKPEASTDAAMTAAKKKRQAATQTTYTSPLGYQGEAAIAKKTLLGR